LPNSQSINGPLPGRQSAVSSGKTFRKTLAFGQWSAKKKSQKKKTGKAEPVK